MLHISSIRKADWTKIKKTLKSVLFTPLLFSLIAFSITCSSDQTRNSVRRTVLLNPKTTTAKVTSIFSGKATYQFLINGKTFTGRSIHSFKGEVGQTACVKYSLDKPDVNLMCDDMEFENAFEDGFLFAAIIFGFTLLLISLVLVWDLTLKKRK